jgi:A/G-specific adenine glycosylase
LQQTRVAQGLPYYLKFVEAYPTVNELAEAPLDDVLRLWQGLGYYSRARNLHTCAKQVVKEYDSKFPKSANSLQQLKGIGPYTAAAISSMAFKEKVPVVDGNVYRVLSRLMDDDTDISMSKAYKHFFRIAQDLIPADDPGEFNQAMMEFGATYCTPKTPPCHDCFLKKECLAYQNNTVNKRPVKLKRVKISNRFIQYFIFQYGNRMLVRKRGEKDIWQGLHDFYSIEGIHEEEALLSRLSEALGSQLVNDCVLEGQSGLLKHILTHQRIEARFYHVCVKASDSYLRIANLLGLKDVNERQMEELAKPILIENYLKNGALSLF